MIRFIAQQIAVGRIMDIRFHHRGVQAQLASFHHLVFLGDLHHSLMNLFDPLRSQRQSPATHGLGVRRFGGSHACEIAIYQVGPDFALQNLVAPVANVLQQQ